MTRRQVLALLGKSYLSTRVLPLSSFLASPGFAAKSVRCINVVNFIREIEPRFTMDMMLPVHSQMAIIREHDLPATWLLQFDALVSGPFVPFLKDKMARSHEVGFWFEMNEKHCRAAGVEWRGRPGYEWDFLPSVAFTLGYSKEERVRLADTAMHEFRKIWGRYPSSVASWNLDSFTIGHLVDRHGVDAFAVCRDQIATDGFTIWGAPIAGYYPSKSNCWSPAVHPSNQISSPIFRMLGQDPVYYYKRQWSIRGGRPISAPDTMEPAWPSGQDPTFVREFLKMISQSPALGFAYAQLGQENTFPWDQQSPGYAPQMKALSELRSKGVVHVETMGDSGRRFKRSFKQTPAQAQVMLDDPFGNTDPPCATAWYQSRYYRANLHIEGDLPYLRDLTVYSDRLAQPYLNEPARVNDVEQRLPAVLDGYHWAPAGGFFRDGEKRLTLTDKPRVKEDGSTLVATLPVQGGVLRVRFEEGRLSVKGPHRFAISLEWNPAEAAITAVEPQRLHFRRDGFDYAVKLVKNQARKSDAGMLIESENGLIELVLAQDA